MLIQRKHTRFFIISILFITFYLLSFTFNDWLSYTMPRHQIIQLPLMFGIGIALAYLFPRISISDLGLGISGLIFILASLIFWMLPLSVDKTVLDPWFNRIMHLNMIICGFLLIAIYREIMLEIRIFFLGMLSAKFVAIGIVMRVFDILLCSSFDIKQQRETGAFLILIGSVIFIITITYFFRKPTRE